MLMLSVYEASIVCLSIPGRGMALLQVSSFFPKKFFFKVFLTQFEGIRTEAVRSNCITTDMGHLARGWKQIDIYVFRLLFEHVDMV